jgi:hypothetical protein
MATFSTADTTFSTGGIVVVNFDSPVAANHKERRLGLNLQPVKIRRYAPTA